MTATEIKTDNNNKHDQMCSKQTEIVHKDMENVSICFASLG
jgi:hypothetical protein